MIGSARQMTSDFKISPSIAARIINSAQLPAGTQQLGITVPCNATLTDATFARFRYTGAIKLSHNGQALDRCLQA